MTQQIERTDATAATSRGEPVPLSYFKAPAGDIFASERALTAIAKTRPWAMLCAVCMFLYAIVGGGLGVMWLLVAVFGSPGGLVEFVILIPPNLIGAPLAFIGGILAVRYHAAVGRAMIRRNTEDLERALIRQTHIWRWAGATVLALFAMPPIILLTGYLAGIWH